MYHYLVQRLIIFASINNSYMIIIKTPIMDLFVYTILLKY